MFGGGDHPQQHAQRFTAAPQNANCQLLAPYVVAADGNLTKPDLETGLKGEFKKWDTNGDGQLSSAEAVPLNDHLRALNVGASPVMDWNGDGHISFDEFAGGWRTMFDICAADGGDVVTKADLSHSPNVSGKRPGPDAHDLPPTNGSPRTGGSGGGY